MALVGIDHAQQRAGLDFMFWMPAAKAQSVLEETGYSYFLKLSLLSSSGGL